MTPTGVARALLAAALLPVVVVVVGGLGSAVLQSIGLMPLVGPVRFSFDAYVAPPAARAALMAGSSHLAQRSSW